MAEDAALEPLLVDAVKSGIPQHLLRIGDGEMLCELYEQYPSKANTFNLKIFGYVLSDEQRQHLRTGLRESIVTSTILGLPSARQSRKSELWAAIPILYERLQRDHCAHWVDKVWCTIDAHQQLHESGAIERILRASEHVTLVTSRDVAAQMRLKYGNLKSCEQHLITAEQAYEETKCPDPRFFERIAEIRDAIRSRPRQGELLLYGTGPGGKCLGMEFMRQGGVALDIGSVFDAYVGKVTRGGSKGPTVYKEPEL